MDDETKLKLEIQRLQSKRDFHQFEYSQITNYFLGLVAFLVAIYIPIIIEINDLSLRIVSAFILIFLLALAYFILKLFFNKSLNNINQANKKMEIIYRELLKENH